MRRHSRHVASEAGNSSKEAIQLDDSPPSSPQTHDVGTYPQNNREADEVFLLLSSKNGHFLLKLCRRKLYDLILSQKYLST